MSIDTHLNGVQVLFDAPQEGFETVPMLVAEPQPAPFFARLRLYHVRVIDSNHEEEERTPTIAYAGKRVYFHPALVYG